MKNMQTSAQAKAGIEAAYLTHAHEYGLWHLAPAAGARLATIQREITARAANIRPGEDPLACYASILPSAMQYADPLDVFQYLLGRDAALSDPRWPDAERIFRPLQDRLDAALAAEQAERARLEAETAEVAAELAAAQAAAEEAEREALAKIRVKSDSLRQKLVALNEAAAAIGRVE